MAKQQDNLKVEGEFYGRRREVEAATAAAATTAATAQTARTTRGQQHRFVDSTIVIGDDQQAFAQKAKVAAKAETTATATATVRGSTTNVHAR